MWKSIGAVGLGLVLSAHAGMAEGSLPENLPEKTLKRMQSAPDAFVADAADLILGYGQDGGITAQGIAQAVAVERASARAAAFRRMMEADLDGDGTAQAEEMAVLIRAEAADRRGRLALTYVAADRDTDGNLSASEMQAVSTEAGKKAVSEAKENALMALMQLDLDGDAMLTLTEVQQAVALAAEKS